MLRSAGMPWWVTWLNINTSAMWKNVMEAVRKFPDVAIAQKIKNVSPDEDKSHPSQFHVYNEGVLLYTCLQTLNWQPFLSTFIPSVTGTSWVYILDYQTPNWTRSSKSSCGPYLNVFAKCCSCGFMMTVMSPGHPLLKQWQRCLMLCVKKMLNSNTRVVCSDVMLCALEVSLQSIHVCSVLCG